jgi:hypothetical protein
MRVFTDLDLNGPTPVRIQPQAGEWGPQRVMATARKRLTRWLWVVALVVMLALLFGFGAWVYQQMMHPGG